MTLQPANELIAPTPGGRVHAMLVQPGLGDCAPSGRMRLDAIARWLQDVAYQDVEDAGLADAAVWVLRRTRIRVERFPRFAERCEVRTFCSGLGRMWAERRTSIVPVTAGGGPPIVEAVAVWVHLDPQTLLPSRLTDRELELYGASTVERQVSARLKHPKPSEQTTVRSWEFRRTDLDLADHVNNAVYWEPLEEELLAAGGSEPDAIDVELEHRLPGQPGTHLILADADWRWITSADGAEVVASAVLLGGH